MGAQRGGWEPGEERRLPPLLPCHPQWAAARSGLEVMGSPASVVHVPGVAQWWPREAWVASGVQVSGLEPEEGGVRGYRVVVRVAGLRPLVHFFQDGLRCW